MNDKAGLKYDAMSAPVVTLCFNYFPHALAAVANVSEYGARKYTPMGWRTVPNGVARYTDALGRHLLKEAVEVYDEKDSGLAHAAQVAWNALARLELLLVEGARLNRRGNQISAEGKPIPNTAVSLDGI
jgi:hypothetical protein